MSPRATGSSWTTAAEIAAKLRRRWTDGTLLRSHALGEPFAPVVIPLRGPTPSAVGDDLEGARSWVAQLEAGSRSDACYTLQRASIGGRHIGRNQLPVRALVATYAQAWALLGVADDVRRFDHLLASANSAPSVRAWALANPHRALQLADDWPSLLAAVKWLDDHRGSGAYLREISAPGVDTKFAERHRATLAAVLGVPAGGTQFLAGLGLSAKPEYVRVRLSEAAVQRGGLPSMLTELVVRADELRDLDLSPSETVVCENETTYLTVPVPHGGLVIWGKGFDVDRVGRLPWLHQTRVTYWGDLDTHGFAILDRIRAWLPQTTSVLMDRDTLLHHRERWGQEPKPTQARLTRLTVDESDLYEDLVSDRFGQRIRLEQERVDWTWALRQLGATRPPS